MLLYLIYTCAKYMWLFYDSYSSTGSGSTFTKPPEIPVETTLTNAGQGSLGVTSPASSVGGESFYTPSRENVIPLSFENVVGFPLFIHYENACEFSSF